MVTAHEKNTQYYNILCKGNNNLKYVKPKLITVKALIIIN